MILKLVVCQQARIPIILRPRSTTTAPAVRLPVLREDEVDCDDIEISGVSTGTDSYNFTAQIYHDSASSTITSIAWGGTTEDESEFCQDLELLYSSSGNDVSCTNCLDTITYALYTSNANSMGVWLGMIA